MVLIMVEKIGLFYIALSGFCMGYWTKSLIQKKNTKKGVDE